MSDLWPVADLSTERQCDVDAAGVLAPVGALRADVTDLGMCLERVEPTRGAIIRPLVLDLSAAWYALAPSLRAVIVAAEETLHTATQLDTQTADQAFLEAPTPLTSESEALRWAALFALHYTGLRVTRIREHPVWRGTWEGHIELMDGIEGWWSTRPGWSTYIAAHRQQFAAQPATWLDDEAGAGGAG